MKRRPEPSDDSDDAKQVAREMADVIPLAPDRRGRVHVTPAAHLPRARPSTPSPSTGEPTDAENLAGGFAAHGVDRRVLRKLKRGDYSPGSRLDLHGMTVADAVASVQRVLETSGRRQRCICIVHGQGRHSDGNVSILKPRVRDWLRRHPSVLAYADAPTSDGGAGAVYVLLRR